MRTQLPSRVRRRIAGPVIITPSSITPEMWHVSTSRPGSFPQNEVGCPCRRAPCGLVIPTGETLCGVHSGQHINFMQIHAASQCSPRPKWWRTTKSHA